MTDRTQERRNAQRVDANLKLEVRLPRADGSEAVASLETINISSSGVYFKSDHFIEPMTKLAMDLELPVAAAEDGGAHELGLVSCEGLVVRITPEVETAGCDSYEVAVFFTQLSENGQDILSRHIALLIQ